MEKTTGVAVSAEASFGFKGFGSSSKETFPQEMKVSTTDERITEPSTTVIGEPKHPEGEHVSEAIRFREDEYVLERLDGTKVIGRTVRAGACPCRRTAVRRRHRGQGDCLPGVLAGVDVAGRVGGAVESAAPPAGASARATRVCPSVCRRCGRRAVRVLPAAADLSLPGAPRRRPGGRAGGSAAARSPVPGRGP
ncbi:hypothetical protein ACFCX4_10855 [Kitasatospora sp. NPDC056327]|uniref:hypothetical protein n=1 Tax=Kitasatospora sp. NPDC056327 TaxID=3345785 RepID=UPI0035D81077